MYASYLELYFGENPIKITVPEIYPNLIAAQNNKIQRKLKC